MFLYDMSIEVKAFFKNRWCVWDSNPGPQDGRRRLNHGAMAAALSRLFWLSIFCRCIKVRFESWVTHLLAVGDPVRQRPDHQILPGEGLQHLNLALT